MVDHYKMAKDFILNEGHNPPDAMMYIQAISEALSGIRGTSQTESRRIAIAKESLRSLRRETRKLQEQNVALQEQLNEDKE